MILSANLWAQLNHLLSNEDISHSNDLGIGHTCVSALLFTSCVTLDVLASGFLVHVMINNSMKIKPSNGKGTGHILSAKELQI